MFGCNKSSGIYSSTKKKNKKKGKWANFKDLGKKEISGNSNTQVKMINNNNNNNTVILND